MQFYLKPTFICLCVFQFLLLPLFAQYKFVENKGQWPNVVDYKVEIESGNLYLEPGALVFDFYDQEQVNSRFSGHTGEEPKLSPKLNKHSYSINFTGSSEAMILAEDKSSEFYNYFLGNDQEKWASNVNAYRVINYKDLYPGIDLKLYSSQKGLKYDFILAPGSNANIIELEYNGVNPSLQKDGNLKIKTSVNEIIESKPYAYQVIDGKIVEVSCSYILNKNKLGFRFENGYDVQRELIIDPEIIFSTYSGSTSDNFGYSATFDSEGNLYGASSSFGTGYPVTMGAYQVDWGGGTGAGSLAGTDIAITKFDSTGTELIYSSYLGGNSDELPHSLIVDHNNELIILGTSSSLNFPISDLAFQNTFGGGTGELVGGVGVHYIEGSDIVISKLSADGADLVASTFLGGSENDGLNTNGDLKFNYADELRGEVTIGPDNSIFIATCTFSPDFPITPGSYQTTHNGGEDGVIVKFNSELTELTWSTYLGGTSADAIYSIHINIEENIIVCGGTNSTDFPSTAPSYQPGFNGGRADAFISILNSTGSQLLNSTYLGSENYDQAYFVETDNFENVFIYGQTRAPDDTFIINAEYGESNSGMLLTKFDPTLENIIWSTVFGSGEGKPNLSPTAFLVDVCDRIYVSGWGGTANNANSELDNTIGLEVTPDAFKSTTNGNDFYLFVMKSDASEIAFGSFYGGDQSSEHVDGGTSRFDRTGKIYQAVCAGCGGNDDFPIHPDEAWSSTNNSTNCNLGVFKVDFDLPVVFADFFAEDVCLPDSVSFMNISNTIEGNSPFYFWDFGDGTLSNELNPTHAYADPGTYNVQLIITDPFACNISDTIQKLITVFPEIEMESSEDQFSCTENSFMLEANSFGSAISYEWSENTDFDPLLNAGLMDSTITYSSNSPASVYVRINNGLCTLTDTISIIPAPDISILNSDTTLCSIQEFTIQLNNLSEWAGLNGIEWSPEEIITGDPGAEVITILHDESVVISFSAITDLGCTVSDSIEVSIFPIILEVPEDEAFCEAQEVELIASSAGFAETFEWSLNADFNPLLNQFNDSSIIVSPGETTNYFIRVSNGDCSLTDTVGVALFSASTHVNNDLFICRDDTTNLYVINDFPSVAMTHQWSPEDMIISGSNSFQAVVSPGETTVYTVVSSTDFGCSTENQVVVYVSELWSSGIEATADPLAVIAGESTLLQAIPNSEIYTYQWTPVTGLENPISPNTLANPSETTTYTVQIKETTALGICAKSDSVTVTVYEFVCGEPIIFLPNAFTPNDDGENDILYLRGKNLTDLYLAIYDRWGELIFETKDQEIGWDGTYKGKLAEPAVFVYYLEAECIDGQEYFKKGNVSLIR